MTYILLKAVMILQIFSDFLCGVILPFLLIIIGIFFLFKYKFFYILHPINAIKCMLDSQKDGFRSLCVALAGTLGVGNIVGVASAILLGGAGSIFWMWISAFCAMSLKYFEVFLAMRFRRTKNGKFYGGAPYYINDGLKDKIGKKRAYFLSCIFALLCVVNSLTTGNLVQVNSVSSLCNFSPLVFGIIFTVIAYVIIIGGFERISKITSVLIPVLSISYILICLYIIIKNFNRIDNVLEMIFKDAFSIQSVGGGFCGYGIASAIRYGVSRGVLSNEAGCGTSPSAHASSNTSSFHGQGCLGILEVFVDTILLCTLTAFVILLSDSYYESNAMSLVISSFEKFTGDFGRYTIIIFSIMFAFATVVTQFFYGSESLHYISKSGFVKAFYTVIFCTVIIVGSVIPMEIMWQISDLAIALMTVFNLVCLVVLRNS